MHTHDTTLHTKWHHLITSITLTDKAQSNTPTTPMPPYAWNA
jgi:hypothetical protein